MTSASYCIILKSNGRNGEWFNNVIRNSIRRRTDAYNKWRMTENEDDWKLYKNIRNEVVEIV